jgi:hypothetical protein
MKKMYEYVPDLNIISEYLKSGMQGMHAEKHSWKDFTYTGTYRSRISLQNVRLCPRDRGQRNYDVIHARFLCFHTASIVPLLLHVYYFIFIE